MAQFGVSIALVVAFLYRLGGIKRASHLEDEGDEVSGLGTSSCVARTEASRVRNAEAVRGRGEYKAAASANGRRRSAVRTSQNHAKLVVSVRSGSGRRDVVASGKPRHRSELTVERARGDAWPIRSSRPGRAGRSAIKARHKRLMSRMMPE
ncbi:hypothetical protein OH77DRAFT_528623 [Trametes cingulata]|nr:hypothetical protein OH77DRAFT_528623 [Trametes cingulata]